MDLNKRTEKAVQDAGEIIGATLSAGQREALRKVIEEVVIDAMRECAAKCHQAARDCCSHDLDMAQKVAKEVEQAHSALVANLSSLR